MPKGNPAIADWKIIYQNSGIFMVSYVDPWANYKHIWDGYKSQISPIVPLLVQPFSSSSFAAIPITLYRHFGCGFVCLL